MAESSPSLIVSGSTCTPQTARGTHLFKIDGYSLYMGLGVGECINSATFAVGGYDWGIDFYPDGDEEKSKDFVSVFLKLRTNNAEARALYDLRLVDQARTPSAFTWPKSSHEEPGVFKTEDSTSACWGYSRFMRKTELQESSYILNDTLVVECNLSVIKFMPAREESDVKLTIAAKVPPSELVANLSRLLEATEGAQTCLSRSKTRGFPGSQDFMSATLSMHIIYISSIL
jgi:speckle-type POZ protein